MNELKISGKIYNKKEAQDSAEYKELNKLAGVKKLAIGNPDLKVG